MSNNRTMASTSKMQQNQLNKSKIFVSKQQHEFDAYSNKKTNNSATNDNTINWNCKIKNEKEICQIVKTTNFLHSKNKVQMANFFPIPASHVLTIIVFLTAYSTTFLLYAQNHTIILLLMTGFVLLIRFLLKFDYRVTFFNLPLNKIFLNQCFNTKIIF